MNTCTTVAKGKTVLKIPKRDGSFLKSHRVHLCPCSSYDRCHSKMPFHMHIFQLNNLSNIFLWVIQEVDLVREGESLSSRFQRECILCILPTAHKAKEKQPDVHIKRKQGAWALSDTSHFPGTSKVKKGQITEPAQVRSCRWESSSHSEWCEQWD